MRAPFLKVDGPWDESVDQWNAITANAEEIFSAAAGDALEVAAEEARALARQAEASDPLISSIETNYISGDPRLDFGSEETEEEADTLEFGGPDKTPAAIMRSLFMTRGTEYGNIFSAGLVRRLEEL